MRLMLLISICCVLACSPGDEGGEGGRDSSGCEFTVVGDNSQGACSVGGDATNTQDAALNEACDAQARAECIARGNPEAAQGLGDCYEEGLAECLGDDEDEDEEDTDADNDQS